MSLCVHACVCLQVREEGGTIVELGGGIRGEVQQEVPQRYPLSPHTDPVEFKNYFQGFPWLVRG